MEYGEMGNREMSERVYDGRSLLIYIYDYMNMLLLWWRSFLNFGVLCIVR